MSITFTAQKAGNGTTPPVFGEEANFSNANAATILTLLGYVDQARTDGTFLGCPILPDAFGDADADDFLGRVVMARALADTAADDVNGTPTFTEGAPGTGGPSITHFGRPPGYIAERLADLESVAADAKRLGGVVAWG